MSDFLSKLVMRSQGSTDVVRPRLASLFEPSSDPVTSSIAMLDPPPVLEDLVDGRPPEAREITHVDPPRRPVEERSGVEARIPRVIVPPAPESPRDRPARIEDVVQARPPAAPEATSVVPAQPALEAAPVVPQPAPVAARPGRDVERRRDVVPAVSDSPGPTTHVRLVSTGRIVPARGETDQTDVAARPREVLVHSAARTPAVAPVPAPVVVRPSQTAAVPRVGGDGPPAGPASVHEDVADETSSVSRPPAPSETARGATRPPSSPRVAPAATIVVQPRVAAYVEPARSPRTDAGAMPEPTIHVTIGRVEVRAVQSAAPTSRRERRAPAAMNLEEYLRRRARAGDR